MPSRRQKRAKKAAAAVKDVEADECATGLAQDAQEQTECNEIKKFPVYVLVSFGDGPARIELLQEHTEELTCCFSGYFCTALFEILPDTRDSIRVSFTASTQHGVAEKNKAVKQEHQVLLSLLTQLHIALENTKEELKKMEHGHDLQRQGEIANVELPAIEQEIERISKPHTVKLVVFTFKESAVLQEGDKRVWQFGHANFTFAVHVIAFGNKISARPTAVSHAETSLVEVGCATVLPKEIKLEQHAMTLKRGTRVVTPYVRPDGSFYRPLGFDGPMLFRGTVVECKNQIVLVAFDDGETSYVPAQHVIADDAEFKIGDEVAVYVGHDRGYEVCTIIENDGSSNFQVLLSNKRRVRVSSNRGNDEIGNRDFARIVSLDLFDFRERFA